MGSDVEITAADREKAAEVVERIAGVPWDVFSDAEWVWVGHVAQAQDRTRCRVVTRRKQKGKW